MLNDFSLSKLPPYAKAFVGTFTTLMLFVCFWAMLIYYVEEGMVDEDTEVPAYMEESSDDSGYDEADEYEEYDDDDDLERQEDAARLAEDSGAMLAPVWDSVYAGREATVDSISNVEKFRARDEQMQAEHKGYVAAGEEEEGEEDAHEMFEHNVELAHIHVNGQTLLYFAIGLVFLFTSVSSRTKTIVYWVFGLSVLVHSVGLTGKDFYGIFNDVLAISGVIILASIIYMALMIYIDLARKGDSEA